MPRLRLLLATLALLSTTAFAATPAVLPLAPAVPVSVPAGGFEEATEAWPPAGWSVEQARADGSRQRHTGRGAAPRRQGEPAHHKQLARLGSASSRRRCGSASATSTACAAG